MPSHTPTRRAITGGMAWAVPVVAAAGAAPAFAASCEVAVTVVTTGLAAGGFDLSLRDGKFVNNATNTNPANTQVVNLTLAVTVGGVPLVGASVTVSPDATTDAEGNRMIGFSPTSTTSGFGESATPKIATATTNGSGQLVVKVSTATYSLPDCGSIPRSGTFTVLVVAGRCGSVAVPLNYRIVDGSPLVICP